MKYLGDDSSVLNYSNLFELEDFCDGVRYEVDYETSRHDRLVKKTRYVRLESAVKYSFENSEWDEWASVMNHTERDYHNASQLIAYYESIISNDSDLLFFKKIRSAISVYHRECGGVSADMELSVRTLIELIRYAPELSKKPDAKIYFDSKMDCFGVMFKQTKRNKGTLNILIKPNNEIMFSFVRKITGVVRFTGRAYLGDSLDNSKGIKALFRMMEW